MGVTEEAGKIASSSVETLGRSQPLALALVIVNVLFLVLAAFILHELRDIVSENMARKDNLIAKMVEKAFECIPPPEWKKETH